MCRRRRLPAGRESPARSPHRQDTRRGPGDRARSCGMPSSSAACSALRARQMSSSSVPRSRSSRSRRAWCLKIRCRHPQIHAAREVARQPARHRHGIIRPMPPARNEIRRQRECRWLKLCSLLVQANHPVTVCRGQKVKSLVDCTHETSPTGVIRMSAKHLDPPGHESERHCLSAGSRELRPVNSNRRTACSSQPRFMGTLFEKMSWKRSRPIVMVDIDDIDKQ